MKYFLLALLFVGCHHFDREAFEKRHKAEVDSLKKHKTKLGKGYWVTRNFMPSVHKNHISVDTSKEVNVIGVGGGSVTLMSPSNEWRFDTVPSGNRFGFIDSRPPVEVQLMQQEMDKMNHIIKVQMYLCGMSFGLALISFLMALKDIRRKKSLGY